jgi:uncharacterized protein with von Willebrand factor type A (vWA) domain
MTLLQEIMIEVFSTLRSNGSTISIGELLDGLNLADEIESEVQLGELKGNLRLLWGAANHDQRTRDTFDSIWEAHIIPRSNLLFGARSAQSEDNSQSGALANSVMVLTPAEHSESASDAQPEKPVASTQEVELSEISPNAVAISTSARLTSNESGGNNSGSSNRIGSGDFKKKSHPSRWLSRFSRGRRRYTFKVVTDIPALLPQVGVIPASVPADLKFVSHDAIYAYKPISRLSMAYSWRYLRRPVSDGPANILDIEATIARVAHQGFFLSPVYRRWQSNHAHLMLLIDQDGSMAPFHGIARDLVETASQESSIQQVDVFYFHDVVDDRVFTDEYLLNNIDVGEAMEYCTPNTSVLIISDAGAARGHQNRKRCDLTVQMLTRFQQSTTLIAWLNPMPRERWTESSAERIASQTQMFQLDSDGFSGAIDVLQGKGAAS